MKTQVFAAKYHIPDSLDPDTVSHFDWYEATGFKVPFPGEKKVRPASDFKKKVALTKADGRAEPDQEIISLRVTNDGVPRSAATWRRGGGLENLAARLQAVGGTLSTSVRRDGQFEVLAQVVVPTTAEIGVADGDDLLKDDLLKGG